MNSAKKVCASNPLDPFGMLQRLVDTVLGRRLPIVMGRSACTNGKRITLPPTIKTGTDSELVRTFFLAMHELSHNLNDSNIKGAYAHRFQKLMHNFYNSFVDVCDERMFERQYPGMKDYSRIFYTDLMGEPEQQAYYARASKKNGMVQYLQALTRYMIGRVRGEELGVTNIPTNPELVADYDTYIADLMPQIDAMRYWRDASKLAAVFMDRVERLITDEMERKAQEKKKEQQRQEQARKEQEEKNEESNDEGGEPSDKEDTDTQETGEPGEDGEGVSDEQDADNGDPEDSNPSASGDEVDGDGDSNPSEDAGEEDAGENVSEGAGLDDNDGDSSDGSSLPNDEEDGEPRGSDGSSEDEPDDSGEDEEPSEGDGSNGCSDPGDETSPEGPDSDDTGSESGTGEDRSPADDEEDERGEDTSPGSDDGEGQADDESDGEPESDSTSTTTEASEDSEDSSKPTEDPDEEDPAPEEDGSEDSITSDDDELPELTDEERSAAKEEAEEELTKLNDDNDPMNDVEDIKRGIEEDFINSGEYVKAVGVVDKIVEATPTSEWIGVENRDEGLRMLGPEAPQMVNLFVNNTKPRTIRFQKRGRMDFRRVNDPRDGLDVKTKKTPGTLEQSAVMLMVDYSSSMRGYRKDAIASQLTSGLLYTLDRGAVPCSAFGYTDEQPRQESSIERTYPVRIEVIKKFEELYTGKVMCRCHTNHYSMCTPDLDAMREYAIPQLLLRKETNKVLLILCDGELEAWNAGLTQRMRYTYKKYIRVVKESGIKVFAFGIQADLSKYFDKDWMYVNDTSVLGSALVDKLREYLFRKGV